MQIEGKILLITETQQVTEKVRKRELILECGDNAQYMQKVKFEAINDKCDLLNNVYAGQDITVHFNLNGREWQDKTGKTVYFNTLAIWKVESLSAAPQYAEPVTSAPDDNSDLPF